MSRLPEAGFLHTRSAAVIGLVAAASLMEATLIWAAAGPLSLAGHSGFYTSSQNTMTWALGSGWPGLRTFVIFIGSLGLAYVSGLVLAGCARGRAALTIAIAGSLAFGVTALFIFPADARDVFHNIVDGRLLWVHHLNPLVTPPGAAPMDPLFRYVTEWRDIPSLYGPLWFVSTAPAALFAGISRNSNILAFKAVPLAFELASLGLVALIAHRTNPRRLAAAVIFFGWNPLAIWEIAANGHNDIVMMALVLLAILLLLSTCWPLTFPVLACSVLVKYVSLILFPVFAIWILRRYGRRAFGPLIAGLSGAGALTLLVLAPFWAGPATYAQFFAQQSRMILSVAAGLSGQAGQHVANTTPILAVKIGLTLTFVLLYLLTLGRIQATPAGAIEASIEAVFLYLVLLTWWFFPWYVVWALPLAALIPDRPHARLIMVFSFSALIADCVAWAATVPAISISALPLVTAAVIFLAPGYYAVRGVWRRSRANPHLAAA